MKKLAFISLAILGFGGVNEIVRGMNPPDEGQCSQSNCNQKEIKLEESDKGKEKVNQVADVSRNNPETTAMIEGIVKQAKDLQEQMRDLVQQVKIAQERANSLTMQETLSPEEKEKMRQYEEIEKHRPVCCLPSPTPEEKARNERARAERNKKMDLEIKKLEKERDYWMAYIDGRKKTPWSQTGSSEERMKMISIFYQEKNKAPEKIRSIDREIGNLRAQFN